MRLKTPSMPFEPLPVHGESITIDVDAIDVIIPTGKQNTLPSFNEFTQNPNRVTTAPCGGLKDSIVQDKFPGSLTIEGDGCYLQTTDGSYTGKTIGAGKLSETSSIIDSGSTGITLATADGIEVLTGDGNPILLRPPSAIVEEFQVVNISTTSKTYTITLKGPDSIESIELHNLTSSYKENVQFTKISTNEYTFSKSIPGNTTESFQLTIIYNSLDSTQTFSDDANTTIGLENMAESWIAFLPKSGPDVDFIHFSERPRQLSYKRSSDGTITQIIIYPGNGSIYHGQITHPDHARVSGLGYVPDILNKNIAGSITKFLQSHGMKTDFPSDVTITTWVVPAISDEKILPLSDISDDYLGDEISLRMCPGEYGCASFVVQSDKDVNIDIQITDLSNGDSIIPKTSIDTKIVKCWYIANSNTSDYTKNLFPLGKHLSPELLLYDDTLLTVIGNDWEIGTKTNPNGNNLIKTVSGDYINLSTTTTTNLQIQDADHLLQTNISKNTNKQFWLNTHISDNVPPGIHTGEIRVTSGGRTLKTLHFIITVLPISLLQSSISTEIIYRGIITDDNTISAQYKTFDQYTTDLQDMIAHGVTNHTIKPQSTPEILAQMVQIRKEHGLNNSNLYYSGLNISSPLETIQSFYSAVSSHGVNNFFVYGFDEQNLDTTERRNQISIVHNAGYKVFCAEFYVSLTENYITNIADVLDLVIAGAVPSATYSAIYHDSTDKYDNISHKIYLYNQPQSALELPHTFRQNYGLQLWQLNYDGAMDFAYQYAEGDVWNDTDGILRDHCFTYPTSTKPIGTIQWEGYREASNDLRYLTTLQAAITDAQNREVSTTNIETWLTNLKTTDLTNADLDSIRSQMIDYILELQSSENYSAVLMADGNPIIFADGTQLFLEG